MVDLIPDAEVVMVAWAKADTDLDALVAGRVATNLPEDPESKFPFLRVLRVGGTRDSGEAPVEHAVLQWDAYAVRGAYQSASQVARTLVAALDVWTPGPVGAVGWVYGHRILTGPVRVNEPETGWARFRVDVQTTFRRA